jgi:TolA-binding protein
MKLAAKLLIYLLLLGLAGYCLRQFSREYQRADARGAALAAADAPAETAPPIADPLSVTNAATNGVVAPGTNAVTAATTNAVPAATTNAAATVSPGQTPAAPAPAVKPAGNRSALFLSGFVVAMLGLAGLGGWDITQFFARRSSSLLGTDLDHAPANDPEYDAAEAEWAKGNHLDAINLMREYLKANPNEQYVAIRIAEIYEKDLNNFLAAVLELEEVLTKRLPREKWGWTAIRLANLYSGRLNQPDKALGVLDRIVNEYPETAAAHKARQRLGLPEPADPAAAVAESSETAAPAEDPNLPQGFRSKKR